MSNHEGKEKSKSVGIASWVEENYSRNLIGSIGLQMQFPQTKTWELDTTLWSRKF